MDPSKEGADREQEREPLRPLPYRLLGQDIVLSYTAGPGLHELDDPYATAKGPAEYREALFYLQEVSRLGIVVRKVLLSGEREELAGPVFFPWSAVHSLFEAWPDEESEEEQEEENQ